MRKLLDSKVKNPYLKLFKLRAKRNMKTKIPLQPAIAKELRISHLSIPGIAAQGRCNTTFSLYLFLTI